MKTSLLIVVLISLVAVGLSSQGKFTVKPKEFPSYAYQIFDIRDPLPPATGVSTLPGNAANTANRSAVRLQTTGPVSRIQRADREFEIFCDELGGKGYRLALIESHTGGFRAFFEREFPPTPTK